VTAEPTAGTGFDDGLGPGVAHPDETVAAADATRRLIAAVRIADAPSDVLGRVAELANQAAALLEEH